MICSARDCTEPVHEPEKNEAWPLCKLHLSEAKAILGADVDDEGSTNDV